ncbi:hypothetical protein [Nonomuraea zeae]|uniref:Uncharacterized protein n=1 Tax=Nonomuraea zeae TaxID=1642303 RepID=A0A5S4F1S2_9ACTN|nr:hypothetical protein [Nonomuraea zeae]TMR10018.1 hypothetical protein ETD85_60905 [Nonomuraea zeae]
MSNEVAAAQLPLDAENALVAELARLVLEESAPEELVLFEDNAAEYFRDPRAVAAFRPRDEPVGFGLDMVMLTPYVLAVAVPVVQFLVTTMAEAVAAESATHLVGLVRRRFRRKEVAAAQDAAPARVEPLSKEQLREVREIAFRAAQGVQLADEQAKLLADAVVGGLVAR